MIQKAIERLAFIKVTRDIIQDKNRTSLNDILDCINYLKSHNLKTNQEAIKHLYEMSRM